MATNYNIIDWGGAQPIPYWNNASEYPALVYWGQALVFARAMDVDTTTKAGISGFSITLNQYIVGELELSRSTYGYFWGDEMRITPSVTQYYTCSPAYQDISAASYFNLSTGATGTPVAKDFFTIGYASRTISGVFDDHVHWRIDYNSISSPATTTIATANYEISVTDVWQGGSGEIIVGADTYYKIISQSNVGSFSAGASNITARATTAQKSRAVTASLDGGVSYCDISYQPLTTLRTTTRVAYSGLVTADSFSGANVVAIGRAKQFWSLNSTTITHNAANNEDTVVVDMTSYRLARLVTLTGDDHAHVIATYTNTSGDSGQSTGTTAAIHTVTPSDIWQGESCLVSAWADAYYVVATESGTGSYAADNSAISASCSYDFKTRIINFRNATFDVTYYNTSGSYATGTQSSGAVLNTWCGGDVTWAARAISYKTITPATGTVAAANSSVAVTVAPTVTLDARTVTISGDSHTLITASYTNTSGNPASISTKSTTAASDTTVWQGSTVEIGYTIDSYYTVNTSSNIGTHTDGTSNITAYATSAPWERSISCIGSHCNWTVVYYPISDINHTTTATGTDSLSVADCWRGGSAEVSVDPVSFYTITSTTGVGTHSAGDQNIAARATATKATRSITASGDGNTNWTLQYEDDNGTPRSRTGTGTLTYSDAWQGSDVTVSVSASAYYKIAASSGIGVHGASASNITASATSTPKTRAIQTVLGTGVTGYTITYYGPWDANPTTITTYTADVVVSASKSAQAVTAQIVPDTYWNAPAATTYPAADNEDTVVVNLTPDKATKTITVNKANYWNEAAAAASIEYVPGSGTGTSTTISSIATNNLTSETFTAWQGGTATVTIVANTYWTVSGGGTTSPSTSDKTYTLRGYLLPTGLNPSRLSATASYSGGTLSITFTNKTQYTMTAVTVWPSDSYAYVSGDRVTSFTSNSISIAVGRTGTVNITSSLIPYWSDVSECSIAIRCRVNSVYRTVTNMYVV